MDSVGVFKFRYETPEAQGTFKTRMVGFWVLGLGFRSYGLGLGLWGLGCAVEAVSVEAVSLPLILHISSP